MTAALRHRGPDAQRACLLDGAVLGHARLAIVDLEGGRQPMRDPRTGLTLVFNGEIYNHVELRQRWSRDFAFRTRSDTEVLLAGFALEGVRALQHFVGQFAFGLFDPRDQTLWLGRDRVGICPLYYTRMPEGVGFASEIKALLAGGCVTPELDPAGVHQSVRLWAPLAPRSCFRDVHTLPPAHVARVQGNRVEFLEYWKLPVPNRERRAPERDPHVLAQLEELFLDTVKLTLRADVPVAAYLSGGLDSSLVCAVAQRELGGSLQTFSVGFERPEYDETAFQHAAAQALRTEHTSTTVSDAEIAASLPDVVEHGEQVLVRSAPAPLFRLSAHVRASGTRVVLTGEGADELFLGYDLFKETKLRQFWARQPESRLRPLLFTKLYPYMPRMRQSPDLLRQFFGLGLDAPDAAAFSHQLRWAATARIGRFFSRRFVERIAGHDPIEDVAASLPESVRSAPAMERAQFIEMQTLLSGYLLSAQGDRMLLGNSVEGRFPFLDHRLIEFAASLPEAFKLNVLEEKWLLRRLARGRIPEALVQRTKQPYRAPIAGALLGPGAPAWTRELLSRDAIDEAGVFSGETVTRLVERVRASLGNESEADSMTLMAVVSTQLLHERLVRKSFERPAGVDAVRVEVA